MDFLLSPIPIAIASIIAVFLLVLWLYSKNYVKVPPNQVAVFTGRGKNYKVVRGGARFRWPFIERVDIMDLSPFSVEIDVSSVYSNNGVPVNVTAVGLVKVGSAETELQTAVERFLTTSRDELHRQVQEILAGSMRGIVAKMTIEDLNNDRDLFTASVISEAGEAFSKIGMVLDVLTIQNISDVNGYLDALGRTRTAEVKKDAEIGEANARRDAAVASAEADQAGKVAQASAAASIAEAERDRDIRVQQAQADVQTETAKAEQAGPLAQAEAQRAVATAEVAVEQARVQAEIEVEAQRVEKSRRTQEADVVIPATAARQAAEEKAQADKATSIAAAQAEAEAVRLQGASDAEVVKLQGQSQSEVVRLQGEAAASARQANATALQAELVAEAAGRLELAEANNAFTDSAMRLQVLPDIIKALPEMASRIAEHLQIDRLVVINGGTGGGEGGEGDGNMMQSLVTMVPVAIAQTLEVIKATTGVDVSNLVSGGNALSATVDETPQLDEKSGDTTTN